MLLQNFIYLAAWVLPVVNAAGKTDVPLLVTNNCRETVWPGLFTSNGGGPDSLGFELKTKSSRNLTVISDWNGRIWGRTNCTFDDKGVGSCGTGACGTALECVATVSLPTPIEELNELLMIEPGRNCHARRIQPRSPRKSILLRHLPSRRVQPPHGHPNTPNNRNHSTRLKRNKPNLCRKSPRL